MIIFIYRKIGNNVCVSTINPWLLTFRLTEQPGTAAVVLFPAAVGEGVNFD